jgi:hypothetical protein
LEVFKNEMENGKWGIIFYQQKQIQILSLPFISNNNELTNYNLRRKAVGYTQLSGKIKIKLFVWYKTKKY